MSLAAREMERMVRSMGILLMAGREPGRDLVVGLGAEANVSTHRRTAPVGRRLRRRIGGKR